MKKLIVATICGLFLTGCNQQTQTNIANIAAEVQAAAVAACKFEPTIGTITQIITANQAATAVQIANLICGAVNVTNPTPAPADAPLYVTINGTKIVVEGNYVR